MGRFLFISLAACVLLFVRSSFGVEPDRRGEPLNGNETLRAFEPRDMQKVQNARRGVYAVCIVAIVGIVVLFIGWARYYTPRYWQRNDPPPQLVRSRIKSNEYEAPTEPPAEDRDRFDLEGDVIDFIREVESRSNE